MLTNARQKMIETIALRDGEVIISKVAKELDVSIETVRRDINALCEKNVLTKVHGGAVPVNPQVVEAAYTQRKITNSVVKNKLGAYAAGMLKNNAVVVIAAGSTMEAVAASITGVHNLTVLTNSLPVVGILSDRNAVGLYDGKAILLGGQVHLTEHFTYGPVFEKQLEHYTADIVFVSASAVSGPALMTSSIDEGNVLGRMLEHAARRVLIIESKKIDRRSIYRFAELDGIDEIITDDAYPLPAALMKLIKTHKIELHIVK